MHLAQSFFEECKKNEIKGKMNFRLFYCMEVSTLFSRQRSVLHKITSERHPRLSACVDGRKKRGANGFELPLTRNFTQLPSHPPPGEGSCGEPLWLGRETHPRNINSKVRYAHFVAFLIEC